MKTIKFVSTLFAALLLMGGATIPAQAQTVGKHCVWTVTADTATVFRARLTFCEAMAGGWYYIQGKKQVTDQDVSNPRWYWIYGNIQDQKGYYTSVTVPTGKFGGNSAVIEGNFTVG